MFCGQDIVLSTAKGSDRGLIPFYGGSESGVRYFLQNMSPIHTAFQAVDATFLSESPAETPARKSVEGGRVDRFKLVVTSEERRTLIARTAMQQSSAWTNPCEKYSTCTS